MGESGFRSLLLASFVTVIVFSSAGAQDSPSGFPPGGSNQAPLGSPPSFSEGTPGSQAAAFPISLVQPASRFEMSASLLFLQPTTGNMVYATVVNPFPFLTPKWSDEAINPSFSPAFNVGMRYWLDSGGDVQLSWTHLNAFDHASTGTNTTSILGPAGASPVQGIGPPYLLGPPPPWATASAVAHTDYDAVNLDAGVLLGIGNHVQMRFLAGVQAARISETMSTNFLSSDGTISFTNTPRSVFLGLGPRLGMDMHYILGNLDLLAGIAGSALIGTRDSRIDMTTVSPLNVANGLAVNPQYITSPDTTQVIPCIDTRVAVSYDFQIGTFGVLRCEAGYQAAVYMNAVNQYSITEVENALTAPYQGTAAVFLRTVTESQSNFLVHGPFVKLCLEF